MYNLNDAVAALRNAETIITSAILTQDEKRQLLAELTASVPTAYNLTYLDTLTTALERLNGTLVPAAEEARPTEGSQDAPQVASGNGAAIAPPFAGTTEGLQEQTQDVRSLGSNGNDGGTPTEAAAPRKGHKQGAHRHK